MKSVEKKSMIGILVLVFLIGFTCKAYSGNVISKQMIGDKEYRVETIDGESGNYMVYWGEDKFKWEPKPWQPDELKKQGPTFYDIGIVGATKKNLFPWSIPLEERIKVSAKDWWDVGYPANVWPFSRGDVQEKGTWVFISPKGKVWEAGTLKWVKSFRQSLDFPDGAIKWKDFTTFWSPPDMQGMGSITIAYQGAKEDDRYFYSPSARKVRRMTTASRQDAYPRSVAKYEDVPLCKAIHNYKFISQEILKWPNEGDKYPGFGTGPGHPDPNFNGEDHRWLDGLGEPCFVMEVTPFREDWWFGKMIKYVGIKTFTFYREYVYDRKGRLIRMMPIYMGLMYDPKEKGQEGGDIPYLHWDSFPGLDVSTGYAHIGYSSNTEMKVGIPDSLFVEQNLLKEPNTLNWWR